MFLSCLVFAVLYITFILAEEISTKADYSLTYKVEHSFANSQVIQFIYFLFEII